MKTTHIRNILVPIDFSKMSIQAIETANRLARRSDATVHLVHVYDFVYPAGFMAPMPPFMPFSTIAFEQANKENLVRQLCALASKHGISPSGCHVREAGGAPVFDEVCRFAREIPADLIVMPTHGRTGLKHVVLGSTAERIVQHAPCPVFVTRQARGRSTSSKTSAVNTILVPVDFSRCSLEGLNYAIAFAEKFAARIVLLHVAYLGPAYTADGYAIYDMTEMIKAVQKDAERQMREFVRAAKFGRVKFETVVKTGLPAREICGLAKDRKVDLIITATHGRTGFQHILIGSTAEHVVRHAPCPVLVVPSYKKVRAGNLIRERGRKTETPGLNGKAMKSRRSRGPARKDRIFEPHPFPEWRKTNKFRESHLAR